MLQVYIMLTAIAVFSLWLLYSRGWLNSPVRWVVSIELILAAFVLRGALLSYETLDYQNFLKNWVEFYRQRGGFSALSQSVGNYNIPYLYFMALFSYSDVNDLYLIKLLSIFFDPLLAFACAGIAEKTGSTANRHPLAVFFTVLFLPTVVMNGAMWGQCDVIFVALALLGIWFALDGRPCLSVIFAALSFGFKLQAVFMLPIYAVLLARGNIRWRHVLLFPVTYIALVLPAVLIGRPFLDTITLYFNQTGSIGSGLNYNSSSIFSILDHVTDEEGAARNAIIAAFAYMCAVLAVSMFTSKRMQVKQLTLVLLLLCLGIPFLLPHMHDRYFFAADAVSVIVAFTYPELTLVPILVQFGSLLGYYAYLVMRYLMPMRYGGYAMILVLLLCAAVLAIELFQDSGLPDTETDCAIPDHTASKADS